MYFHRLFRLYTKLRITHRNIYSIRYIFIWIIIFLFLGVYILITSYIYNPINIISRVSYISGSLDTIYDTRRYTDLNRYLSGVSSISVRYTIWEYPSILRTIQSTYPYIQDIHYEWFSSNTVKLSLSFVSPNLIIRNSTNYRWIYDTPIWKKSVRLLSSAWSIKTTPIISLPRYTDSYTWIDSLVPYLPHDTILYTLSKLSKANTYLYIPVGNTISFVYDGVIIYLSIKNKNLTDIDERIDTIRMLRTKLPYRSTIYSLDIWHSSHPIITYK